MLNKFVFNVYLPSIQDYVKVSELQNKEYINILKFNKNKDITGLSCYLEWLVQEKTDTHIHLHRIDKFCIILTLLMVNIAHQVTLIGSCDQTDQEFEVHVDVADVLNQVTNVQYTLPVITHGNIKITMKYPSTIMTTDPTVQDLVDTLSVDDDVYPVSDMTEQQFNNVIGSLPGKMFKTIIDTVKNLRDRYAEITLLDVYSPYVDDPTHTILTLDLMGNTLFDLICTLLGQDLNGFYEMQFAMMNNYKFPPDYYMNITPSEVKTFYGYMKSDVEKKNQHLEQMKNSRKSPIDGITG